MTRALVIFVVLGACGAGQTPAPAPAPAPTPAAASTAEMPPPSDEIPARGTALKSRAHPFALYITRLHRQLHPQWGERVLAGFDQSQNSALRDPSLAVQLAIAIDATGSLAKLDVITSSKLAEFDDVAVGAFRAAGPFPVPPEAIKSRDGLVHFRWTLYRDYRQCGTFSVEPLVD